MLISNTNQLEDDRRHYSIGRIKASSTWRAGNAPIAEADRLVAIRALIREAEEYGADAIIDFTFEVDGVKRADFDGAPLQRIAATGIAVKFAEAAWRAWRKFRAIIAGQHFWSGRRRHKVAMGKLTAAPIKRRGVIVISRHSKVDAILISFPLRRPRIEPKYDRVGGDDCGYNGGECDYDEHISLVETMVKARLRSTYQRQMALGRCRVPDAAG
jgi:hypothetical protein